MEGMLRKPLIYGLVTFAATFLIAGFLARLPD